MSGKLERAEMFTAAAEKPGAEPLPAYAVVERDAGRGTRVLQLSGEFDLIAAPALRERLHDGGFTGLVLDLTEVTFVDPSALKELLRAREEMAARGVRIALAGVPRSVERLLALTGTTELFEAAPDAEAAVRRLTTG
jgi:anti-sigma B factor antagonist